MDKRGLLLVFSTAIISGVSIFINKFGVAINNANLFTGLKNFLVGIFLFSILILARELRSITTLHQKDWLKLILVGLVGGAIPFILFYQGLTLTSAAKASLIHKSMFIYVGILAIIFLREKLNKNLLIGIAALLIGNIIFLQIRPQPLAFGDLLIFLATLMWAAEITLAKYLLRNLPANLIAWARMFFGAIFIFSFLFIRGEASLALNLNINQWYWIGLTSVFLIGYVYTFYHGLKRIPASVATSILALGAPVTGLLTLIFDNRALVFNQWLGLFFILAGALCVIGFKNIKYGYHVSH